MVDAKPISGHAQPAPYRLKEHNTTKCLMLLSLNCARGGATTFVVLHSVSRNPRYLSLLLQEPWLTHNKEPPQITGFDVFLPTPTNPKCVTYVRKSASLQPVLAFNESDCFLGIRLIAPASAPITVPHPHLSPGRQQAVCHLFHGFRPDRNAIICGTSTPTTECGIYGNKSNLRQKHLSGDSGLAESLVKNMLRLSLRLRNKPGVYTHFPRLTRDRRWAIRRHGPDQRGWRERRRPAGPRARPYQRRLSPPCPPHLVVGRRFGIDAGRPAVTAQAKKAGANRRAGRAADKTLPTPSESTVPAASRRRRALWHRCRAIRRHDPDQSGRREPRRPEGPPTRP